MGKFNENLIAGKFIFNAQYWVVYIQTVIFSQKLGYRLNIISSF